VEVGVNFLQRKVIVGAPVSIEEQQEAEKIAAQTLLSMQKKEIDTQSLGQFINSLPINAAQRKYFYSRLQISYGKDPQEVALRMIDINSSSSQTPKNEDGCYYRVASGNMSVAQTIADRVKDVRFGYEIRSVEYSKPRVSIRGISADGPFQLEMDGVVFAVPVKILSDIEFDPPLPSLIHNAINSVSMGTAAKITVATCERPTLRAYHDVEKPYWCWTGRGEGGKVRKVITAFCGSGQPQEKLATNSGEPAVWFEELKSANPDLDFEGEPVMVDWSNDKWARGCYSAFSNQAADDIPHLTKSVGNIFFAGEHTAYNSATMDGAIESGLRAANQVREQYR
jgi:monoamine oxidase